MEGPQVKALAWKLNELLAGCQVERIDVPADRWQANVLLKHCASRSVARIYSHGRWLIWDFSHGISWICYPLRRWRWSVEEPHAETVPRQTVGSLISAVRGRRTLLQINMTGGPRVVLYGRPLLLVLLTEAVWRHPELAALGPDVLDEKFTAVEWATRLRNSRHKTLSQALLDQSIAAGIGNQSKCEILFATRLHPSTRIAAVSRLELEKIAHTSRSLLQASWRKALGKRAHAGESIRVHDRAGEPCDLCSTPITVDRSGGDGCWTWYCPACQMPPEEPMLFNTAYDQDK
jgi:endonuclease VIII